MAEAHNAHEDGVRLEMAGLSRAEAEAASLELRRLANHYGIDIEVKIERAAHASSRSSV
jgi:hypothetical protein